MKNQTECDLLVKDVDFEGYKLKSAQNKQTQKIYVGVSWVCNGIGLSKSQKDTQVQNIQSDEILKTGCLKFQAGVFDANNETLALDIDFLPLWLAKISITPKMKKNKPSIVSTLINYQLKAKDVLAKAFLHGNDENSQVFAKLLSVMERNNELLVENNAMRPKAEEFDQFIESKGYISLNKVAKALKVGRNKMMAFLRENTVLFIDNHDNIPYQKYINAGYFIIDCNVGRDGKIHAVTRASAKGVSYIHKLYQKYAPSEKVVA